jgi:phage FluMu protein gp41
MKNFLNKKYIIFVVLVLIILFVVTQRDLFVKNTNTNNIETSYEVLGNKENLLSFSIMPGMEISNQIAFIGNIEGGYFFEANILVNILDKDKNLLKAGYANATSDWMTSGPVAFQGVLDVSNLPKGFAYVQLLQDDPSGGESGLPIKEVFVPIVIN